MNSVLGELIQARSGGVFRCHSRVGDAQLGTATAGGMRVEALPLHPVRDKHAFLDAVGVRLGFPDHFGHNWDAFYDCLTDLTHDQCGGILLLLREASGFARAEPEEFAAAIDAMRDAATFLEDQGQVLLVVVELDNPVLAPEIGEVSVNPRPT